MELVHGEPPTTDNLEAYGKAVAATQEPILPEYGTLNPPSSPAEKEAVDGVRWKCLKLVDGTDSDPYAVCIVGVLADPARIARAYGINDGMLFSALKKILRSGRKHKAKATDIREAITSLERWEAMNREDQKQ